MDEDAFDALFEQAVLVGAITEAELDTLTDAIAEGRVSASEAMREWEPKVKAAALRATLGLSSAKALPPPMCSLGLLVLAQQSDGPEAGFSLRCHRCGCQAPTPGGPNGYFVLRAQLPESPRLQLECAGCHVHEAVRRCVTADAAASFTSERVMPPAELLEFVEGDSWTDEERGEDDGEEASDDESDDLADIPLGGRTECAARADGSHPVAELLELEASAAARFAGGDLAGCLEALERLAGLCAEAPSFYELTCGDAGASCPPWPEPGANTSFLRTRVLSLCVRALGSDDCPDAPRAALLSKLWRWLVLFGALGLLSTATGETDQVPALANLYERHCGAKPPRFEY